jgi:hypothetical protein
MSEKPKASAPSANQPKPIKKFSEMLNLPNKQRVLEELRLLESLMAQAVKDKDWSGALKIQQAAHEILQKKR